MKMIKIFPVFLLLFVTFSFAGSENTDRATIKYLGIFNNHVDIRMNTSTHINPAGCTKDPPAFYRLHLKDRDPWAMALMAVIVKAYNDNEPLILVISDEECDGYAPKVIGVRIGNF